jgi:hypothetical protein
MTEISTKHTVHFLLALPLTSLNGLEAGPIPLPTTPAKHPNEWLAHH